MTQGEVSVVVVAYNALPWIEQCLASVGGHETVVVDHGSTDGTVAFVREKFPAVRLVEQENRGLAAGWNRGIRETSGEHVLILNADAWALGDAIERLADFADAHPRTAVLGPRLRYPDGRLQPSVRGFPTHVRKPRFAEPTVGGYPRRMAVRGRRRGPRAWGALSS